MGVERGGLLSRLTHAGVDPDVADDLIAACTRGFVKAVNEREEEPADGED